MEPRNQSEGLSAMVLVTMISGELAGSVLLGVFLGRLGDNFLHTTPLFLIIGILLGLAAGVYSVKATLDWFYGQENRKNE